jgi:hypothetical protein
MVRRSLNAEMSAREACVVVASLAILSTIMHWPLPMRAATAVLYAFGDPLLVIAILAWDADRIARGLQDFWQAPILWPAPDVMAYSEHLLGVACSPHRFNG